MSVGTLTLCVGVLTLCVGCGTEVEVVTPAGGQASVVGSAAPLPPAPAAPAPARAAAAPAAGVAAPAAQPGAAQPAAAASRLPNVPAVLASDPDEKGPDALGADAPDREEAQAGVGKKGRGYGGGLYTEPIHQKFTLEQRLIFEDQIPHALDLYKADHNNRGPRTHDEFMKDIIAFNNIVLPELPEGDKYIYDPKLGKLMVEHPAK